jgi:hypothetical protein
LGTRDALGQVMHDPIDIRRRIDRLVARVDRRDDYGQLPASGQVVHRRDEVGDVDAWRAEIRRQARADKLKIRTGFKPKITALTMTYVPRSRRPSDNPGGRIVN